MKFGHQQIECVVIYVLVHIECREYVEGLLVGERFRNKVRSKNGNEMSGTYDVVEVYDGDHWASIQIALGLQDPQTGVVIRPLLEPLVPMDEGTWIGFPFEGEAKKEPDSDDRHPQHSWNIRVAAEERTVVSGRTFSP